jgi:hypothetical protein
MFSEPVLHRQLPRGQWITMNWVPRPRYLRAGHPCHINFILMYRSDNLASHVAVNKKDPSGAGPHALLRGQSPQPALH